eukprot:CAMPEP_0117559114 /NCGR_PEP_ID=MMETSP0784-20121206/53191_1 /TAXON_ID=39447 /ORGANISM="" /LENGTH=51 /DNA_ID=CAMNT_0005356477 /DNA_START=63 /DNA_END=215 /DNA_ORIENTATION=-
MPLRQQLQPRPRHALDSPILRAPPPPSSFSVLGVEGGGGEGGDGFADTRTW